MFASLSDIDLDFSLISFHFFNLSRRRPSKDCLCPFFFSIFLCPSHHFLVHVFAIVTDVCPSLLFYVPFAVIKACYSLSISPRTACQRRFWYVYLYPCPRRGVCILEFSVIELVCCLGKAKSVHSPGGQFHDCHQTRTYHLRLLSRVRGGVNLFCEGCFTDAGRISREENA